jgi:hypothetical protein
MTAIRTSAHSSPLLRTARSRRLLVSAAVNAIVPALVYLVIRPSLSSDSASLAIAGAIPVVFILVTLLWQRRVDFLAVGSAIGFAIGCMTSVLLGGNSLPLKLHDAVVTFSAGMILLCAVLIRRPIPLRRVLRVPGATKQLDASLGAMIGGFLVLHALLRLTLALTLPTSTFVVTSRVVGWGTIAIGVVCLRAYLRRSYPRTMQRTDRG